ncbi:DNA cytosine methyltransferase [Mesorhizobium sp. VK23B]|uniref:DNA (cytosine-5-)-methyltransferase n=1 Tax=Mesorhizobium dulcispinae TaxID=3072316 RepID=A0ABU4XB85_9HYPH|nr:MULTISPECIES: DNA cytosine methyltransferase [unclassified Mesorhizobium]MDX8465742.1 DNA cytosine methyltransferase [Mesorhizobium sp. VK23B]MDX8471456.1 DNA cytosine methyltransferase [Mesorhizobium sp. VK23A]
MKIVEMFSGCGGLAYGLSASGLKPVAMVEADGAANRTLEANKTAGVTFAADWPITHSDVRRVDWRKHLGNVRVVAGGPPCQPFSQAGKGLGDRDLRDMWPEAVRAVREIRPEGFLFENVRGLLRPVFESYVEALLATLSKCDPVHGYAVDRVMVDAADFGAPQRRQRVIVAGFRTDIASSVVFPEPTHSRERLLWDQWVTGEYWEQHGIDKPGEGSIPRADKGMVDRLLKLRNLGREPKTSRWRTVRDALADLGEPNGENQHDFQPGARVYAGHTGSMWDQPAKALKAGMHGVPGGENMLRLDDGRVRYFTVREMARLHGFPDEFVFPGNRTQNTRQLGNAVPVALAQAFASWMRDALETKGASMLRDSSGLEEEPELPLYKDAAE